MLSEEAAEEGAGLFGGMGMSMPEKVPVHAGEGNCSVPERLFAGSGAYPMGRSTQDMFRFIPRVNPPYGR